MQTNIGAQDSSTSGLQAFRLSGSPPAGSVGVGEALPSSSVREEWDLTNDCHMADACSLADVANIEMRQAADAAHMMSEQDRFQRTLPNSKKGKFVQPARCQSPALSAHSARSRSGHGEGDTLQEVCNQHANGNYFASFDDANGSPIAEESDDAGQMPSASAHSQLNEQSADAQASASSLAIGDDAKARVDLIDCSAEPCGKVAIPVEPHCG